jgi:hypothetical protein
MSVQKANFWKLINDFEILRILVQAARRGLKYKVTS